jgi:hypothetical protein
MSVLGQYVEAQMDAGILRRMDSQIAARSFFGPLIVHVLLREVFQLPEAQGMDDDSLVRSTAEIFLRGLALEREPVEARAESREEEGGSP